MKIFLPALIPVLLSCALPCRALCATAEVSFDANAFLAKALQKPAPAPKKTAPLASTAAEWLALVEKSLNQSPASFGIFSGPQDFMQAQQLIGALPGPETWDAIATALEERPLDNKPRAAARQILLRLLIHELNNNPAAAKNDLAALDAEFDKRKQADASSADSSYYENYIARLRYQLALKANDSEAILSALEKWIAGTKADSPGFYGGRFYEAIPDLVGLAGEARASEFFRQALAKPNVTLNFSQRAGTATRRLASKLALEMCAPPPSGASSAPASASAAAPSPVAAPTLAMPHWELVNSIDDVPLYTAMREKFPDAKPSDNAAAYYLASLIAEGKTAEAAKIAREGDFKYGLPSQASEALKNTGHDSAMIDFLKTCLSDNPDLPFWNNYIALATDAGRRDEVVSFVEEVARREGLSDKARNSMLSLQAKTYLAADDTDKAAPALLQWMEAAAKNSDDNTFQNAAQQAVTIGQLLDNESSKDNQKHSNELVEKALALFKQKTNSTENYAPWTALANILAQAGRTDEALETLAQALQIATNTSRGYYFATRQILIQAAALYAQAGRWQDVRTLLDRAPGWGQDDISASLSETCYANGRTYYLGCIAARALAETGSKDKALAIVDAFLDQNGGYDPAYELRMNLAPDTFPARCDELFARDRFEERPLIWKAQRLLDLGRFDEAEKCARDAIAIDPTDGEQPVGDRLRAYAVLAKICAAKGNQKEADFLNEAVYSVRRSEEADRLLNAGLSTRARKIYEESLGHFIDAYCIHARLALRLAEEGDMAGAEAHYQKAYELMPASFGRVESYCFGCEGAFRTPQAQGIAERVFTKLAAANPENPQNHYLLGYLRLAENRYEEALAEFRKAVALDADYLNAWNKMDECAANLTLPDAQQDEIYRNILRLDPLGRHSSFEYVSMFDKWRNQREAWQSLEAARKQRPPVPAALYPLASSQPDNSGFGNRANDSIGQQLYQRCAWAQALAGCFDGWRD